MCQPYVVATAAGDMGPTALAADGAFVYWAESDGSIQRADVAPGSMPVNVTAGGMGATVADMVVDGGYVYWIEASSADYLVQRAKKAGGARRPPTPSRGTAARRA